MVYGFRLETETVIDGCMVISRDRNVYPMDRETAERRLAEEVEYTKAYCPRQTITRAEVVVETRFEEV